MATMSNLGRCFRCNQLGHWAKYCSFSDGSNGRGREGPLSSTNGISEKEDTTGGPVSSVTSDIIEKKSELMSTTHSENDSKSTTNMTLSPNKDKCFKCFQQGHWAHECPSSNGNNVGGEAVSSTTSEIFKKDVNSTSSCIFMPSKSDKCFKCQQPGHWAKNCPSRDSNSKEGPNSSSDCNIPQKICICGRGPCVIFTSNTAKNPGRQFYKCPYRECEFFEWCDGQTSPSKDNNTNDGYDLLTRCPCGAGRCPVLTAQTKKNMGRQFVCCPVRKGEGSCGFFKWCEELDSAASSFSSIPNKKIDYVE